MIKTETMPTMLPMDQDRISAKRIYNQGRWSCAEHALFLEGLRKYGKQWFNVAKIVQTRSVTQIRTHAQKYFAKQEKEVSSLFNHVSKRSKIKCNGNKIEPICLEKLHTQLKKTHPSHLSIIPSHGKQGMSHAICAKLKLLIKNVAVFLEQETKRGEGSIHLSDMQIAIENGSYPTLERAITALLVRVKALESPRIALQAQRVVLSQLPILFLPHNEPNIIQVPKLNFHYSQPHKLPPLAEWAPLISMSYPPELWDQTNRE